MLRLINVSKRFSEKPIVEKATLRVDSGELVCLTGPSGIGKTTLLEIMAGILPPDSGMVERQAEPALMFQDDALVPWLSAKANVTYVLPDSLSADAASAIADAWLQFFELEAEQYPAAMSGGMRRRLSLARTFAIERKLILLDEPFAFLDSAWQEKVAKEIAASTIAGSGIILTTHSTAFLDMPCFRNVTYRVISLADLPLVIDDSS